MPKLCRTALVAAALILCVSAQGAPWPEIQSDMPPDPAVTWGVLPNGVRYAVRHNAEPKGRVSLRLLVGAGSLYEREEERGIAHFVEHMAYRGTREHPNGGLTTELQRLGVGFGPDTAAYTYSDHTIYQLELPDTSEATLLEGLGVFREYAQDISFEPALIEKERDVVLNEMDMRDTPDARAADANLRLLFPDSVQVRRKVIGLAGNIRSFSRSQLVSFYDAWYRPERMVVVAVGDIDTALVARLIGQAMRDVRARGAARADTVVPVPAAAGMPTIRVFTDGGLRGAGCSLEHPFPEAPSPDTRARRAARLRRDLAFSILQRRASKLSKDADGGLVVPQTSVVNYVPGWAVATFEANGTISDWKAFMSNLELQQRSAFRYGFTAAELEVARTSFAASYANAVLTSATWHSDWLATAIANSVVQGFVFSTPALAQQDTAADLAAATPQECLEEFRRAWSRGSMHVFVRAYPAFTVTATEIADALNASRQKPAVRPLERAPVAFAYTDFGPPGRMVKSSEVADLGVRQAEFANGVRLNFKQTPFEVGSVTIFVRVGSGRLSQPASCRGIDLFANAVVPVGGLGKHPFDELQDVLAGHTLSVNFAVDSDALDFTARCAPQDLGICLRLITAHLTDAAYRPECMPDVRASISGIYASISASPSGPISAFSTQILSGGDVRFGVPVPAEMDKRTIAEVRTWIEPQLKGGPIEMSVVGDTPWESVAREVASTLGALPPRAERSAKESSQLLNPPAKPTKPAYIFTTDPALRQVGLSWSCLVPDMTGFHKERRCRLLASLLAERMRVRLRMELGASYAFDAEFVDFDGFPDFSFFTASTTVAPEHARRADELVRDEIDSLRCGRFTADEFERVKVPMLRSREEDLRSNGYWGYTVLRDAQQRPERLEAARDRQADCAAITRGDIESLASHYFMADRWFQFVAYPKTVTRYRQDVEGFDGETRRFGIPR
jgi:zinc protease